MKAKILWILLILVLLGYLLTGVTQIRPGERAVVRRFGRILEEQPRPGLWIGLPWGMEEVEKIAVDQVRQVTVGYQPDYDASEDVTPPGQFLTGDNNLVNIQIVINYRINPDELVAYVRERDSIEPLLALTTESALAEWIAAHPVDEVLLRGSGDLPSALLDQTKPRLARYHLGIEVQSITVTHLQPPDQVKSAFDRVTRARTEIQQQILEAQSDADRKWSEAQSRKIQQEDDARTYVFKVKRLAQAEARAFEKRLAEYRRNPGVLQTGRLEHRERLLMLLRKNGVVQPIDPNLKPGPLAPSMIPGFPRP